MNVLLVSPQTPTTFWSLKHAIRFVSRRAAFPPLGLLTMAATLPREWSLRVVDMDVLRLKDSDILWADYVLISAMIVHKQSVLDVVARCHGLNRTVIGGGPLFTTGHEEFAGVHCVCGECEEIIDQVIQDMELGQLQPIYGASGEFPDITRTPVPRFDLIQPKHYATMSVQFSRGCPYDCEFCDVIVMNGRKPRTKTCDQVLADLECLLANGWKGTVFFVDDNFIGNKKNVKLFLQSLIAWRRLRKPQLDFITEASVNLADDAELMELMVQAGFRRVFLGIETPVEESLVECQKRQNMQGSLAERVRTIQRSGLEVMAGFIVGFDNDPLNVFEQQFEFIQKTGIPAAMVGLLTALPKTRLYQRLVGEGRLHEESTGNNTEATLNFVTKLDRDFLLNGYRQLMQTLYEPAVYYRRVLVFLKEHRHYGPKKKITWRDLQAAIKSMWSMGLRHRGRLAYWRYLATVLVRHPQKLPAAFALAIHGFHYRMVARNL